MPWKAAMTLATVYSRAAIGLEAPPVAVEVDLSNGLPAFTIVGLPEAAVRESRERVRGALLNSNFEFPARRITVNLAPADLPKEGGRFDLPIALGILLASSQIQAENINRYEYCAELSLGGKLRPVRGVLPTALAISRRHQRGLVVAAENSDEAILVEGLPVIAIGHLLELVAHLTGAKQSPPSRSDRKPTHNMAYPDLRDVRGQPQARRGLELAAAGGHSLLMVGPPGTGKSMLANRLPGLLPVMSEREALETASIQSVAGNGFNPDAWSLRPFRSPHHSASGAALVGGGSRPLPGEISLAHNGILFLDELTEFDRRTLELLREPLESGVISLSRVGAKIDYPARFQLVAAMNPCPCGYLGGEPGRCCCTPEQIGRYRQRLSGPLMDRIDLHVELPSVPVELLQSPSRSEDSGQVRSRVLGAREQQLKRGGKLNYQLTAEELESVCRINSEGKRLLATAMAHFGLSVRAYYRILRLARTLADLQPSPAVRTEDIAEAIQFRKLDRPTTPQHHR